MVKSREVTVVAGLIGTTLTIEVVECAGPPLPVQVAGYLKDVDGNPLGGKNINLYRNGVLYSATSTLGDGSYGFYLVPVGIGDYGFIAEFLGDVTYDAAYAGQTCTYAKVASSLSIAVSPTSGFPPFDVDISGTLSRNDTGAGIGGRTIEAYRRDPTGYEEYLGWTDTEAGPTAGNYSFVDTIPSEGDWVYYVQFAGDDYFIGCEEITLPCPGCGLPIDVESEGDVVCYNCGAISEVVMDG